MDGCNGGGSLINSFALVSYLPAPLGGFLDQLRSDLIQTCHARAHVTVLPPRPLPSPPEEAWAEVKSSLQDFQPFWVELRGIEVFPATQVIYLSIGGGFDELERLHTALNAGRAEFQEPYPYHPHVTLAQELEGEQVAAATEFAERRWREFTGPRRFMVDQLTFVQNSLENRWMDLAQTALPSPVAN